MENKVILTKEELDRLKSLQDESNQLVLDLGTVEMQILMLNDSKSQFLQKINELNKKQSALGSELNQKYGQGVVDLNTGEFIKN